MNRLGLTYPGEFDCECEFKSSRRVLCISHGGSRSLEKGVLRANAELYMVPSAWTGEVVETAGR